MTAKEYEEKLRELSIQISTHELAKVKAQKEAAEYIAEREKLILDATKKEFVAKGLHLTPV